MSGMRSDCDLVLWISAQSAAVSGITFYRSANDVILTEATIDPAFFHSVQIMRSLEVLTADGGPPHPQQVALAISRASSRDAQRHGQYMRVVCAHATVPHRLKSLHASNTHAPVLLTRRTGGLPLGSRGTPLFRILWRDCRLPNRLRKIRIGCTVKKRRRRCARGLRRGPKCITCILRSIGRVLGQGIHCLYCLYSEFGVGWRNTGNKPGLNATNMLFSHAQRTRVCRRLPPPTGSGVSHRPNENNHFTPSSRPGPKSGVGSCFTVLIMMIQAQLTHSVRVPALSAGAGEGNPYAHLSSRHAPKPSGIQVVYGKQDPTHDWNRYVKRSFKRACRQAITHGRATYKGRTLTVQTSPSEQPHTVMQAKQHTPVPPQRHLKVYCHNVGGLGSGMYEDLMGFLDQSHYDIVLVQETKLREASEYTTARWICVGSGTTAQKHAGVMILVRKSLTNVQEVRHDAVIPGRLLRVRFPLGTTGRLLSVVCAYQHAWNPKDPTILDKRSDFWHKLSHCIGGIPYREALVVGGDLNVQLTPKRPCVGHGTGALSPERAPDADALHTLLSTHTLVALNTWGKPGKGAHTFTFGKHQAQLDYLLMRASQTTRMARQARPLHTCPVGGWRHGGGFTRPLLLRSPSSITCTISQLSLSRKST